MKKWCLLGLALALLLPSCDEEGAKKMATQIFRSYFQEVLDAEKAGEEVDHKACKDRAAKEHGFEDWNDFITKASKVLKPEVWVKIVNDATEWYDEQAALRKGGGDEGPLPAEGPATPGSALPPVFRPGAKLGDPVAREYVVIREVRGEWIRGDHVKLRGDAKDTLAKDAWIHAPSKDWSWVAMP
ncbi:MAG: hypothetical protein ACYTFG_09555 [Planctomycetota bacterium]|jgi:hypothetical protein